MTQDSPQFNIEANPLSDEDLDKLNEAQRQLATARQQVDLAKSAGIDVSRAEDRVSELETQIRSLKSVYFPGR